MAALAELPASPPRGMNGFAPEELPQRGADPAAAAAVSGAGSVSEVPAGLAPPGLAAGAAGSAGAAGAGGPGAGQLCCLREEGERCGRAAGNASFSKRIQKSISQKKVKIELDKSVSLTAAGSARGAAFKVLFWSVFFCLRFFVVAVGGGEAPFPGASFPGARRG